jgi:hypothetical protein
MDHIARWEPEVPSLMLNSGSSIVIEDSFRCKESAAKGYVALP